MATTDDPLMARAKALKLYGLLAHWEEVAGEPWIEPLIQWEEEQRARRSLERRLGSAHLGRFRPLADFDWDWPKRCDREAVEELMGLAFLEEIANAILVGPNGVGKSTIARNIAHQAVLAGHTVLCTSAAQMLNELAAALNDDANAATNLTTLINANTNDIADVRTTQGTSDGDTNLGTFTGSTIADNQTIKAALQALETAQEATQADVDQNESDADTAIAAVQADVDQNEADADAAIAAILAGTSIPGPYNNDAAAATGGVAVGAIYKNSNGSIHWRVS